MGEVHSTRAVLKVQKNIPKKDQREVAERLREAYGSRQKLQEVADSLNSGGYQRAANTIERFLPGLLNYKGIPETTPQKDSNHECHGEDQQGIETENRGCGCVHQ